MHNAVQGHWYLHQSKALAINFLLVINSNFGRILHRFRDIDAWISKFARFAYPTLLWGPRSGGGNPLEFRDETYSRKTRGMGLLYGENCVILASTVFDWSTRVMNGQTDRQTDGIAMAYTRYSILYAVARKKQSGTSARAYTPMSLQTEVQKSEQLQKHRLAQLIVSVRCTCVHWRQPGEWNSTNCASLTCHTQNQK